MDHVVFNEWLVAEKSVSMECACACHKKDKGDVLVTDNQIPNPSTLDQSPNPPTLQGHIPNPPIIQEHIPNPPTLQGHIPNPPIIQEHIPNPAIQEHWSGQEPDSKCINVWIIVYCTLCTFLVIFFLFAERSNKKSG